MQLNQRFQKYFYIRVQEKEEKLIIEISSSGKNDRGSQKKKNISVV